MPKYLCTVNSQIHIIKEITDTIEIEAPDEVQAEEDAETAAQLMEKTWLKHPAFFIPTFIGSFFTKSR